MPSTLTGSAAVSLLIAGSVRADRHNPGRLGRAAPGILRGRPLPWVTPENGYTSENARCAEFQMDCGFTVDGEIVPPEPGRVVTVSARDCVQFVRA